jgi:phosphoribosylanthranilate isomerase
MAEVKICGNTNVEDAVLAKQLGADFLGLIFTDSKRKVTVPQAKEIMAANKGFDRFVGVFSNQPKDQVELIVTELGLKWVQFHGIETSRYCAYFTTQQINVIKTFRIQDHMSLKRLDEYDVTSFLFDTYSRHEMGGTGQSFNWSIIEDKPYVHEKLFLAGGLTVNNLANAIQTVAPYAVDVASGVETSPGKKDPQLLEQFIKIAKGK